MPPPSDRLKGLMLDSLPAHVFVALPQTGEIVWVNNRYLTYRWQAVAELYENPWGAGEGKASQSYGRAGNGKAKAAAGQGREGRLGSLVTSPDIATFWFVPSHNCKKTCSLSDSRLQDPKRIATQSRLTKTAKLPTPHASFGESEKNGFPKKLHLASLSKSVQYFELILVRGIYPSC
jgi:hypothetical protein